MSYKTILVYVSNTRNAATCMTLACEVARAEEAHLIGMATTGISRFMYQAAEGTPRDPSMEQRIDILRRRADELLDKFDEQARGSALPSFERNRMDDDAAGAMTLRAPYCDLVVLPQYDPEAFSPVLDQNLPAYVAMNGGCPILLVPREGSFNTVGEHVLIGWNASMEVNRAVRAALPLLRRAKRVEVVLFNPETLSNSYTPEPGADIALYLARHGVPVTLDVRATYEDAGAALMSLAKERGADMVVMGCYGRSRFRELLLGGSTYSVLRSASVPVLMAH